MFLRSSKIDEFLEIECHTVIATEMDVASFWQNFGHWSSEVITLIMCGAASDQNFIKNKNIFIFNFTGEAL